MRVTPTNGRPFRMWGALATRDDNSMLPQLACALSRDVDGLVIARSDKAVELRDEHGNVLASIIDDHDRVVANDGGLSEMKRRLQPIRDDGRVPSPMPTPRAPARRQ